MNRMFVYKRVQRIIHIRKKDNLWFYKICLYFPASYNIWQKNITVLLQAYV